MIITLAPQASAESIAHIESHLQSLRFKVVPVTTPRARYLVANGQTQVDMRRIGHLPGIADIHQVQASYQLVSSEWKVKRTRIDLGDGVSIGEGPLALMAGPCSIENEAQIETISQHLHSLGVRIMRGGVFKPRSSPYAFRGLGIEGLKTWHSICKPLGIKIISEVMQVSQIEEMAPYVDIFQVGARNTQNFNLLDALGHIDIPVLLKRGISGTLDELLHSAEYIFSGGNERILLCERGIRTYETASRNTLDLNAVPILKEKSHLPVIVDPSHGIGLRQHVSKMALAAAAAGADGLIYEIHPEPEVAASDGAQTLNLAQHEELVRKLRALEASGILD